MAALRFLHSSDWQLGMTRHFLSPEAQARFSQARIDAIRTLGRLAEQREAEFLVVAGDVFESNQLSPQTVQRSLDALAGVPVPVFLLPGNHDPLDAASIFDAPGLADPPPGVTVIRDREPLALPGHPGVEIVGAPWTSKRPVSDLCGDLLEGLVPGLLRIAVAHGQVDALSPDDTLPGLIDLERAEAAVADGRIHYLALGDRHSTTEVGASGAVWYSGAPVATDFTEVEPNQALLVEVEVGRRPRVERLAVGDWRFIARDERIDEVADVQRLETWLQGLPDKERTMIKIALSGSVNLATAAALDALFETQAEVFASLKRRDSRSDLVIVPDRFDEDSVALSGYAREAWGELLRQAGSGGEEAGVARDALALCYRLAGAGR